MKNLLLLAVFTVSSAAFGAANDVLISFSTPGPDKYADGTTVKDGECYALVWTKAGATFAGLVADGTAVGSDSDVLVFAPLAKGGRCPTTLFELDAALAERYTGGSYAVYLVDTRLANGALGGVGGNGLPVAVNGYGPTVGEATSPSLQDEDGTSSGRSDGDGASPTVRITTKSALPANAPKPQITAIRVVGDKVFLTVKNTLPCLQYKAQEVAVGGASSPHLNVEGSASAGCGGDATPTSAQGAAAPDAEITIIAPKKGESGFYSVGRE